MNALPYGQPYQMNPGQGFNRIIRRPMTPAERELPANYYRAIQKAARGLGVLCVLLFVIGTFVLPAVLTDPSTLDGLSITMTIFSLVFGAVAIGMAINTLVVRKKVQDAMMAGVAVEVTAPAYRGSGGGPKMAMWTVGPVSVMPMRGFEGMLVEGMPVKILLVPSLKAAIAINDQPLRQGLRVTFPPNLEGMATPVDMPPLQMAPMSVPQYQTNAPQSGSQAYLSAFQNQMPPPPP